MISLSRAAVRTRQGADARIGSRGVPDDPASRPRDRSRFKAAAYTGKSSSGQSADLRKDDSAMQQTKGAALAAPPMLRPGASVSGPTGPTGGPVFVPNAVKAGVAKYPPLTDRDQETVSNSGDLRRRPIRQVYRITRTAVEGLCVAAGGSRTAAEGACVTIAGSRTAAEGACVATAGSRT